MNLRLNQADHATISRLEFVALAALTALGSLRVLFFSAAFPLFNNVDEQAHFDLVIRYSHADPPRRYEPFGPEAAKLIVLYGTLEYFNPPSSVPDGMTPPPVWWYPEAERRETVEHDVQFWTSRINHESMQPPAYYVIAGAWTALGRALGATGGGLLYWIRLLSVAVFGSTVVLSWWITRRHGPNDLFIRLGVPAMLAFFPQSVFYGMNNDILSPLLGILVIGLSLDLVRTNEPRRTLVAGVGLSAAAAVLSKLSNLPLLIFPALVIMARLLKVNAHAGLRRELGRVTALTLCVAAPLGLFAWHYGRLVMAVSQFSWTAVPFFRRFQHPLFTTNGFGDFMGHLAKTFWRGELIWHLQPLANQYIDQIFCVTSIVFLLAAATVNWIALRREHKVILCDCACYVALFASVGYLGYLSISFDFGRWYYPSREFPYFASGRLISSALVPFVYLYVRGIDATARALRRTNWRWAVLIALVSTAVVSEVALSREVVGSAYNWFHI